MSKVNHNVEMIPRITILYDLSPLNCVELSCKCVSDMFGNSADHTRVITPVCLNFVMVRWFSLSAAVRHSVSTILQSCQQHNEPSLTKHESSSQLASDSSKPASHSLHSQHWWRFSGVCWEVFASLWLPNTTWQWSEVCSIDNQWQFERLCEDIPRVCWPGGHWRPWHGDHEDDEDTQVWCEGHGSWW